MRFALFGTSALLGAVANLWRGTNATDANVVHAYGDSNPVLSAPPSRPGEPFDGHFRPYKLGEMINLAEDVAILRFLLPHPEDEYNLKPCSTLQTMFKSGAMLVDQVARFYTPITANGEKGYFDVLVKKQPNGRMTERMFSMEVGESLLFRMVQYKLKFVPNRFSHVGMIAGGTGITPVYQWLQEGLMDPEDKTPMTLLFANQRASKILLRGVLDEFAEKHPDQLKVHYVVDKADEPNWKGYEGHINKKMIQRHMPPSSDPKSMVLVCGPDPMMTTICGTPFGMLKAMSGGTPVQPAGANLLNFSDPEGYLGELGYDKEQVYRF